MDTMRKLLFSILFTFICGVSSVNAGNEIVFDQIKGFNIRPGVELKVYDQNPNVINISNSVRSQIGVVTLGMERDIPINTPSDSIQVTATVYAWINGEKITYPNQIFNINYSSTSPYRGTDFKEYEGASSLEVKVTFVRVNHYEIPNLNDYRFVFLEASIQTNRVYQVSAISSIDTNSLSSTSFEITWDEVHGAEFYEVEWTFVEDYTDSWNEFLALNSPDLKFNYLENSSRIQTNENSYKLSLFYDHGYLLYRVRSVGYDINNPEELSYTSWSDPDYGVVSSQIIGKKFVNDPLNNMNYQVSINFSDDGKRKELVQYYDGSLKNRQNVTRLNSNDQVMVQETIYDHIGRPAVNVLPAISGSDELRYHQKFNIKDGFGNGAVPYSWQQFELAPSVNDSCQTALLPEPMSNTSGAAHYYSEMGFNSGITKDSYVPKANGYPFTITQYTPDGTNRVKYQGNPGVDYTIASGHEVENYYPTVNIEDLVRLFGTDVKESSQYRKVLVKDASGQSVVTYLDAAGNVIANGLMGQSTQGLMSLGEDSSFTQKVVIGSGLASEISNSVYGMPNEIIFEEKHTFTRDGSIEVLYSLEPAIVDEINILDGICFDCMYNYRVEVLNACFETIFSKEEEILPIGGIIDVECEYNNAKMNREAEVEVTEGDYYIRRILTLDNEAINDYFDSFLHELISHAPLTDEFDSYQERLDLMLTNFYESPSSLCFDEVCSNLSSYPDYESYLADSDTAGATFVYGEGEYNYLSTMCEDTYSGAERKASALREAILSDIRPGGQYGNGDGENDSLSIYSPNSILVKFNGGLAEPELKVWQQDEYNVFYDPMSRKECFIEVVKDSDTSFQPPLIRGLYVLYMKYNEDGDLVPSYPHDYDIICETPGDLANYSDFARLYEDGWGYTFMHFHPEYKYYTLVKEYEESESWNFDDEIARIQTYEEADSQFDLYNSLSDYNYIDLLENDPFFHNGTIENEYYSLMLDDLLDYPLSSDTLSVKELIANYVNYEFNMQASPVFESTNQEAADMMWDLYRNVYNTLKMKYVDDRIHREADEYYNGCIELYQDNFDPDAYGFDEYYTNENTLCPCHANYESLFRQKARRYYNRPQFELSEDILLKSNPELMEMVNAEYETEQFTKYSIYPVEEDLFNVLKTLIYKNIISQNNTEVSEMWEFSDDLTEAIGFDDFSSSFSNTGFNTFQLQFTEFLPGLGSKVVSLTDMSADPVDWVFDEIVDVSNLQHIGFDGVNHEFRFTVSTLEEADEPELQPGDESVLVLPSYQHHLIYVSTDIPLNYKLPDFELGSEPSGLMRDMRNFIEAVSSLHYYHGSAVSLPSEYHYLFTDNILLDIGVDRSQFDQCINWEYQIQHSFIPFNPYGNGGITEYRFSCDDLSNPVFISFCFDEFGYGPYNLDIPNQIYKMRKSDVDYLGNNNYEIWCKNHEGNPKKINMMIKKSTGVSEPVNNYYLNPLHSLPVDYFKLPHAHLESFINSTFKDLITNDSINLNDRSDFVLYMKKYLPDSLNIDSCSVEDSSPDYQLHNIKYSFNGFSEQYFDQSQRGIEPELEIHLYITDDVYISINSDEDNGDYTSILDLKEFKNLRVTSCNVREFEFEIDGVLPNGDIHKYFGKSNFKTIYQGVDCNLNIPLSYAMEMSKYNDFVNEFPDPTTFQNVYSGRFKDPVQNFFMWDLGRSSSEYMDYLTALQNGQYINDISLMSSYEIESSPYFIDLLEFHENGYREHWENYLSHLNDMAIVYGDFFDDEDPENYNFEASKYFVKLSSYVGNSLFNYEGFYDNYLTHYDEDGNPFNIREYALYEKNLELHEEFCALTPEFAFSEYYHESQSSECDEYLARMEELIIQRVKKEYNEAIEELEEYFIRTYTRQCFATKESISLKLYNQEYQFTLYYYDNANNLIKTVPPAGVDTLLMEERKEAMKMIEDGSGKLLPDHRMVTNYYYNSLNQLVKQTSPDVFSTSPLLLTEEDRTETRFYYDKVGRLRFSQNPKQREENIFSYTKYDYLGRVVEVGVSGELSTEPGYTDQLLIHEDICHLYVDNCDYPGDSNSEVVITIYDLPSYSPLFGYDLGFEQENLRNRISGVKKDDNGNGSYEYETHYSYDIHGNVKSLLQAQKLTLGEINESRWLCKRMDYDYDLISGNVKFVHYQDGQADQFHHKYRYDDDNRLTHVFTSRDGVKYNKEAKYFYYDYGPLKRVEYGSEIVQGVDYAYTLQGWLKGVNSETLDSSRDIGHDGENLHANIPVDVFGFTLSYNDNDFDPVESIPNAEKFYGVNSLQTVDGDNTPGLYNGNIAAMVTSIVDIDPNSNTYLEAKPMLYNYRYDVLNRLRKLQAYSIDISNSNSYNWDIGVGLESYYSEFNYDNNGNLTTLQRNGLESISSEMDNLTYNYNTEVINIYGEDYNVPVNNRLKNVNDLVTASNYSNDIDSQIVDNYTYDAMGNLIGDVSENIEEIVWNNSGKVKEVIRNSADKVNLEFKYDAMGSRVAKIASYNNIPTPPSRGMSNEQPYNIKTFYVRDASGNIMATYKWNSLHESAGLILDEVYLYGSDRLGLVSIQESMNELDAIPGRIGARNYELKKPS
jgi:hypothetical protein